MAVDVFSRYYNVIDSRNDDQYLAIPVEPDGNCFYYSISYHLFEGNVSRQYEIRQAAAQYILSHPKMFEPFLDEKENIQMRVDQILKPRTWAGNLEVWAVALAYGIQIYVFKVNSSLNMLTLPDLNIFLQHHRDVKINVDLTKFTLIKCSPTADTGTVAKKLIQIFSMFGLPKKILTDRGSPFCSELIDKLTKTLGI